MTTEEIIEKINLIGSAADEFSTVVVGCIELLKALDVKECPDWCEPGDWEAN